MKKRNLSLLCVCLLIMTTSLASYQNAENTEAADLKLTQQSQLNSYSNISSGSSVPSDCISIQLSDGNTQCSGSGVEIDGDTVTIRQPDTYLLAGTLSNGQVVVDCDIQAEIILILNGVEITCLNNAPIRIQQAEKTTIYLGKGTENILSDGSEYTNDTNEPNAVLFSRNNLTIDGDGTLLVNANYNTGIVGMEDLTILNGTLEIYSVDDGIVGNHLLDISGGNIYVTAQRNGIKSVTSGASQGNINISGGDITIYSESDGIHAVNTICITGGSCNITTGNGSESAEKRHNDLSNEASQSDGAKGLSADADVLILAGQLIIDAYDDCISAGNCVNISGGDLILSSGDEGIYAHQNIVIEQCEQLNILTANTGMTGRSITINDGDIDIICNEDGVNISSEFTEAEDGQSKKDGTLAISGGALHIDALGESFSANSNITMTGGQVIVNNLANDQSEFDYNTNMEIDGGVFVSSGGRQLAAYLSETSQQNIIAMSFTNVVFANSTIQLLDDCDELICEYTLEKSGQSLAISTPEIQNGTMYKIVKDGADVVTFNAGYSAITYVTENGVVAQNGAEFRSSDPGFAGSIINNQESQNDRFVPQQDRDLIPNN